MLFWKADGELCALILANTQISRRMGVGEGGVPCLMSGGGQD